MNTGNKLKTFIEENVIAAEHLEFGTSCHSVAEAAAAAGVTERDFVKSICMISKSGRLVVAIVKGEDRADRRRVGEALGEKPPRLARDREILEMTGYPCGGTPPFGFGAVFVMDDRVMEMPAVWGGGGSVSSLVRIAPQEIRRLGAVVAQIRVMEAPAEQG